MIMQFKPLPGTAASHLLINGNGGVFDCNMKAEVPVIRANSNTDGHAYIRIKAGSKFVYPPVKTLVALAWLPGATLESLGLTDNFTLRSRKKVADQLIVGHRNGNKYDNSVNNLVLSLATSNKTESQAPEQAVPLQDGEEGAVPISSLHAGLNALEHDSPDGLAGIEVVSKLGVLGVVAQSAVLEAVEISKSYAATLCARQAGHNLSASHAHTNPSGSSFIGAGTDGQPLGANPTSSSFVAAAGTGQSPRSYAVNNSPALRVGKQQKNRPGATPGSASTSRKRQWTLSKGDPGYKKTKKKKTK